MAGVLWSQLIGVLCGVATNLSPLKQAFRKELSELNNFMSNNALDQRTRFRLREYLHQSVHMKNAAAQRRILAQLSPGLHSEVVWRMTQRWLLPVRFLRGVEKELLIALCFHVNAKVFPPSEICPSGVLYIIYKGTALYAGKMCKAGDCFGEDILMRAQASASHGIAISYLWVYTLTGKDIKDCLQLYPESQRVINKVNTRWMMARMVVRAARIVTDVRKRDHGGTSAAMPPGKVLARERTLAAKRMAANDADAIAAKKFAAAEAERAAIGASESDKITALTSDMLALKQQQSEMLALLKQISSGSQLPTPSSASEKQTSLFSRLAA